MASKPINIHWIRTASQTPQIFCLKRIICITCELAKFFISGNLQTELGWFYAIFQHLFLPFEYKALDARGADTRIT